MAIGEGGIENPYVHSNIDNWSGGSYSIPPTLVESRNVENSINTLKQIRKQLAEEANRFLMGASVETLDYNIDTNPTTYSQIARRLIQSHEAKNALINNNKISSKDAKKAISKLPKALRAKIEEVIPIEEDALVSSRILAKAIAKSMGNKEGVLTKTGLRIQQLIDASAMDQTKKELEEAVTKIHIKRLKSTTNKIVDIVEEIINKSFIDTSNIDSVSTFMMWFRTAFLKETEKIKFFDVEKEPEDYLEKVESELRSRIQGVIKDERNAVGALGDEVYVSVMQADSQTAKMGITLESVGKMSERDVAKRFPELSTMITHHDLGKSSQTDIVVKNKNGMVVRVQAKNSLINKTYENKNLEILNAHLQRSINVIQLLQNLGISNLQEISYAIVNSLWFSAHVSVSGHRTEGYLKYGGSNGGASNSILSNLRQELNALLGMQATNFLGITLEQAENESVQMIGNASNIFYLRGGKFIPTYILVDQVIEDLEKYMNGINDFRGLKFTLENSGKVSWVYPRAEGFWVAKVDDEMSNRVSVATAQGAAAISSLSIHGNFQAIQRYTSLTIDTNV